MIRDDIMARRLEWGDAQSLDGEAIEFFPDDSGVAVALRVTQVSEGIPLPGMRQFRLVFHGPARPVHAQGTYLFRHARLGDYAFMITPIRADATGADYEACFSHAP